jgi:hypothetical protein
MIAATHVAVALDALVDTFTSSVTGVQVVDGQPLSTDAGDILVVGYSPDRVTAEISQAQTGLAGREETLNIVCLASSLTGNSSPRQVRDAAVVILEKVKTALKTNPTLGGQVRAARLGWEMSLDQVQTTDGPTATIEFVVEVVTA